METKEIQDPKQISDGYHTMAELYEHRHALTLSLLAAIDAGNSACVRYSDRIPTWKTKLHDDGTMFEDMFLIGMDMPTGRVTYHLPIKYWDVAHCGEIEKAPPYDGHTSDDCLKRLFAMLEPDEEEPA